MSSDKHHTAGRHDNSYANAAASSTKAAADALNKSATETRRVAKELAKQVALSKQIEAAAAQREAAAAAKASVDARNATVEKTATAIQHGITSAAHIFYNGIGGGVGTSGDIVNETLEPILIDTDSIKGITTAVSAGLSVIFPEFIPIIAGVKTIADGIIDIWAEGENKKNKDTADNYTQGNVIRREAERRGLDTTDSQRLNHELGSMLSPQQRREAESLVLQNRKKWQAELAANPNKKYGPNEFNPTYIDKEGKPQVLPASALLPEMLRHSQGGKYPELGIDKNSSLASIDPDEISKKLEESDAYIKPEKLLDEDARSGIADRDKKLRDEISKYRDSKIDARRKKLSAEGNYTYRQDSSEITIDGLTYNPRDPEKFIGDVIDFENKPKETYQRPEKRPYTELPEPLPGFSDGVPSFPRAPNPAPSPPPLSTPWISNPEIPVESPQPNQTSTSAVHENRTSTTQPFGASNSLINSGATNSLPFFGGGATFGSFTTSIAQAPAPIEKHISIVNNITCQSSEPKAIGDATGKSCTNAVENNA